MKKIIINTVLIAAALLLVACSEAESVKQDPPVKGVQLLVSMLDDLKEQDYNAAKAQLDVYRASTSANPFFETMESTIIANKAIKESQAMLDSGDTKAALEILYNAKLIQPLNSTLDIAYQKVSSLVNAQNLIAEISGSESYDGCLVSLNKFENLVSDNPEFASFTTIISAGQERLKELELKEFRQAQFNLLASAKEAKSQGDDNLAELLMTQYKYEIQQNPERQLSNSGVEDVVIGQD